MIFIVPRWLYQYTLSLDFDPSFTRHLANHQRLLSFIKLSGNHCLMFRYTKTGMGGKHKGIAHSCVMKVPASEFAEYCQILSTCPSCFLVGLVIINHLCWVSSSAVTCCCCTLPFLHHVVQSSHFSC